MLFFFFQAEDGIRDKLVTGVQTCALPIFDSRGPGARIRVGVAVCGSARQAARSSDTSAPVGKSGPQSSSSEKTSWPATKARKLERGGTGSRTGPALVSR